MIPSPLGLASEDRRITGDSLRVLIQLHTMTDYFTHKPIKLAVIALRLGTKKPNISRAMRALRDAGYVDTPEFDPTIGMHTYRLTVPTSPTVITGVTRRAA